LEWSPVFDWFDVALLAAVFALFIWFIWACMLGMCIDEAPVLLDEGDEHDGVIRLLIFVVTGPPLPFELVDVELAVWYDSRYCWLVEFVELFDWFDDVEVAAAVLLLFVADEDDCVVSLFVTVLPLYVPDVDWAVALETGGEYILFLSYFFLFYL
jgi:hypothetical protein